MGALGGRQAAIWSVQELKLGHRLRTGSFPVSSTRNWVETLVGDGRFLEGLRRGFWKGTQEWATCTPHAKVLPCLEAHALYLPVPWALQRKRVDTQSCPPTPVQCSSIYFTSP